MCVYVYINMYYFVVRKVYVFYTYQFTIIIYIYTYITSKTMAFGPYGKSLTFVAHRVGHMIFMDGMVLSVPASWHSRQALWNKE